MTIARFAIARPVTVSMFFVAVVLFGVVSLDRLALNLLPEISYPSLTIQTDYEDAAPEEIESLVTRPIEEGVGVVPGLRRLSSVSRPGQSEVVLEFAWDSEMDFAAMDVREKLDLVQLPRDVKKPVILRFDPSFDPIMRLQLHADISLVRLRTIADRDVKKRLESVEGVAAVKIVGGREEQIRIELDEKKLAELGVPITEVTDTLRQEDLNQASGSLYDLDANYLVRMLNEFRTVDEIREIVIRDTEGRRIVLGDIASVWRGERERSVIARYDGSESVEMALYKEGDANTVTVAAAIKQRLGALKGEKTFPKGVEHAIVFNQADFISQSVANVLNAAVIGGALAIVILFAFLRDLRSTLIIGLSIPISIMATFAAMYQTGLTLNIMSLGGVALGVGMLVDNSIVVLESIHRHRSLGGSLAEQVYRGTSEVGGAVTASTLTTIAVFAPLVFVEGIAGQLFRDQALTITYSLLASLAVALTFIPMALALTISPLEGDAAVRSSGRGNIVVRAAQFVFVDLARVVIGDVRRALAIVGRGADAALAPFLDSFEAAFDSLAGRYPRWLRWSLDSKTAVLGVVLLTVVFAGALTSGIGGELIPPLTQGEFSFELQLPEGAPIERTDAVVAAVEQRVRELPEVATVFSSIGGSQKNQFSSTALEENFGRLYVVMKDKRDSAAEEAVIERVRAELSQFPEVRYSFLRPTLFSFKTPIEVEVFAFDLDTQREAAEKISERLAEIDGLGDIRTTSELGNPEIQIRFDRAQLARLGLAENQVSQTLRNKVRGDVATRYRDGERQIDILVRASEADRDAINDLRNLVINAPRRVQAQQGADGRNRDNQVRNPEPSPVQPTVPIRLAQVAEVTIARGPSEVRRVRSQRAALVTANLTGRDLSSVSAEIREVLTELRPELPVNTTVALGGQNEELETSYRSLMFALGLAVFLVYLVMASQFESLKSPFVIMFSVPLALIGVVFALAMTGTDVSVVVLLGVIILAGIVVNNAIVLIDYTNQLRREGLAVREALVRAAQVRLRPIVMTTLTTVLGLAPMAVGWGEGSEIRAPMAIAVMGGLILSTLLTLVVIPVVYEMTAGAGEASAQSTAPEIDPDTGVAWE